MRVIASQNKKGGVGKSLVSGLIAEYYAILKKKRVLLIDLDEQANTTEHYVGLEQIGNQYPDIPIHPDYEEGSDAFPRSSIADIFYGRSILPYPTWVSSDKYEGSIEVAPANQGKFEDINTYFGRKKIVDENVISRLYDFLNLPDLEEFYDVVVLDTGPSRNTLFRVAMRAATDIIIPCTPEGKDLQGVSQMIAMIREENDERPQELKKLQLLGVLPNKVDNRRKLHKENLRRLKEGKAEVLTPENTWLSNLADFPKMDTPNSRPASVYLFPESNMARIQATNLCQYIESKVGVCTQERELADV